MKKSTICIFILFFVGYFISDAQIEKIGKISKEEFKIKNSEKYKESDAVVLFKERKTYYTADESIGWRLVTKVHERVLLKNKDGFEHATKKIKLFTKRNRDEKVSIKAYTYNLVNGKIKKTKLSRKDIFKERINKFWFEKKFTMPNLSEGSIVEWEYTITSPYIGNISDVIFQKTIPIKYFEAKIVIPEYFIFQYEASKYYSARVEINTRPRTISFSNKVRSGGGWVPTRTDVTREHIELNENVYKAKLTDIPAIKEEPYMNDIQNYIGKINFELSGVKYPNSVRKSFAKNWDDVTKTIYENSGFGSQLNKTKYFDEDLSGLVKPAHTQKQKINLILNFVKNKIKWNGLYGKYTDIGVKKAYNKGEGNVAEINLILTAMLRKAGLQANPILVSSEDHGIPIFPTLDGFNYVISGVEVLDDVILLDATEKYSQPDVLPRRAMNWMGRIIRKNGSSAEVDLFPKKYSLNHKRVNVKLSDNYEISGMLMETYLNSYALIFRNKYSDLSKDVIIKKIEEKYDGFLVKNVRVSNTNKLEKPLKVVAQFSLENTIEEVGDKIFFSPLLFLKDKENIFKSDIRHYPIYFGFPRMDRYEIVIDIPSSLSIEKIPKNTVYTLPDDLGSFSYNIKKENNKVFLIVETKINASIIPSIRYREIKDFFNKIVLKHDEKVILKSNK